MRERYRAVISESPYIPLTKTMLCSRLWCVALLTLGAILFGHPLAAQENFLVATQDGTLSLYDLASNSLLASFQGNPLTYTIVAGPNNRLAFSAGGAGYGAVVDTSIGRNVSSLTDVRAPASTMGAGGKYYLAADYNFVLDVVDSATLALVRTVNFSSIIPRSGNPGAIVSANNKAYIFPRSQRAGAPHAAVVDLSTFQLSSIALPAGTFCRRCASRTPDGTMVVVFEVERADNLAHLIFINTATNTIAADIPQIETFKIVAFRITPNGSDQSQLFGYIASDGNVWAVDLRPGSETYGQILFNNKVGLSNYGVDELAVSSDGSRVIAAEIPAVAPPVPNVDIVDAQKLISDPNHALIASLTVAGGITADTVCTGFFLTTPPNTAPTVTGASGPITNDQDNDIQITGTNFQPGALVRIGSVGPFQADVQGSTMLDVTVPADIPAGQAQDIIVTNPQTNDPPSQQNQSGLLPGQFTIFPNPKFQPTTEFATINQSRLYVYDLKQQSMVNVPTGATADIIYGLAFNQDGKYLYLLPLQNYSGSFYVRPVNLKTNTPGNPIPLPSNAYASGPVQPLVAARDPQKNTPVIYASWTDGTDLHLSKIDSDSSSPTFNTIIHTFDAGLSSNPALEAITVSPDNKFAYGWYNDTHNNLGIFDLSTGAFTSINGNDLGINSKQYESQVYVAPDGKSLLLANTKGARTSIRVFDLSNPLLPKRVTEITPFGISRWGFPYVVNYQVIGNKLYGIDLNGAIVVFNFDRSKDDFRERGFVNSDRPQNYSSYVFSPDGSYIYVVDYFGDNVFVGDTSKLVTGKDPQLTAIRSPFTPYLIDASPVSPPAKAKIQRHTVAPIRPAPPQFERAVPSTSKE